MLKYERNLACRYYKVIYDTVDSNGNTLQHEICFKDKKKALDFIDGLSSFCKVVCMDEFANYQYLFKEENDEG